MRGQAYLALPWGLQGNLLHLLCQSLRCACATAARRAGLRGAAAGLGAAFVLGARALGGARCQAAPLPSMLHIYVNFDAWKPSSRHWGQGWPVQGGAPCRNHRFRRLSITSVSGAVTGHSALPCPLSQYTPRLGCLMDHMTVSLLVLGSDKCSPLRGGHYVVTVAREAALQVRGGHCGADSPKSPAPIVCISRHAQAPSILVIMCVVATMFGAPESNSTSGSQRLG